MNISAFPSGRLALKEPRNWFAAGSSFQRALTILSDGAFKLFAHLCLQADRRTGTVTASQVELAAAIGRSKRIIGRYVDELQSKAVCSVHPARNQHAATSFEILDAFWPYHRTGRGEEPPEMRRYVESLRDAFLGLGCTSGNFGAADVSVARDLYHRRIPLGVIDEAMLMAACRKYSAWLNGQESSPIQSMRYFESVIAEIQQQPLPAGYAGYLRRKVGEFAAAWAQKRPTLAPIIAGHLPPTDRRPTAAG